MAKSSKIRVMLSSRSDDVFPSSGAKGAKSLSAIRKSLKSEIEGLEIFGQKPFEVWINEDAPPAAASDDSWEKCMKEVRDCDILIVLSNGNAGWAKAGGSIGICHAEYSEGLATARGKVWLVSLGRSQLVPTRQARETSDSRITWTRKQLFEAGTSLP